MSDLLACDAVYSEIDLLCWLPRESHTRTEARHRFWREANAATWNIAWTDIRVVARFVRQVIDRHPNEGVYEQCERDDEGATPVWRCEPLGRDGRPMPELLHERGVIPAAARVVVPPHDSEQT